MELSFKDIDWRSILLKRYKDYHLSEDDVMIIFMINEIKKMDENSPITNDILASYMCLSKDTIDTCLSNLIDKGLILYTVVKNTPILTLQPLLNKIFKDTKKDLVIADDKSLERESENAYELFQKALNRTLSAIENDKIRGWMDEGATLSMFQEAISTLQTKGKRLTLKKIGEELLRIQKEKDFDKEGYTARNEEVRDPIRISDLLNSDEDDDDEDK